jgi:superfamily II DNA or RNA helicase
VIFLRTYEEFLKTKRLHVAQAGFDVINLFVPSMFGFQVDCTRWALGHGRAAIWADTGLGKTLMELEFARAIVEAGFGNVLLLAPLAVAQQTISEAKKYGTIIPNYAKDQSEVLTGLTITNYDRLENFDLSYFVGVILDESSILKSFDGKTRNLLIDMFSQTRFKLACTATPAPNDHTEIGNHAEFLGILTRAEMLAMWFSHDGGDTSVWRLKGHAEAEFWKWVSSWAVAIRKPSDLGYPDTGYDLPGLELVEHILEFSTETDGSSLFNGEALGLLAQRRAKKRSMNSRISELVRTIALEPDEPWMIWCETNEESALLKKLIPGSVEVKGSDKREHKENSMLGFSRGEIKVLISKDSICGFGMNWQHCARTAFVGLSNSYERFYQAIRRFYRFGQKRVVQAHLFYSQEEAAIKRNLDRKQADAEHLASAMAAVMRHQNVDGLNANGSSKRDYTATKSISLPRWLS